MNHYIEKNEDGSLKSSITTNLPLDKLLEVSGKSYVEVDRQVNSLESFWWIDGALEEIPVSPGPGYEFDPTVRNWVPNAEKQAAQVRAKRDAMIAASDWVVARCYEVGVAVPEEWRLYRTALRDITEQAGFPANVTWPTAPEGLVLPV